MTNKENKAALKADIQEMFKDFEKSIFEDGGKLDRLLNSGVIDFSEPQEDLRLAKQVLMALGSELSHHYRPPCFISGIKEFKHRVQELYSAL